VDYEGFFKERLDALRAEGRYRVFADLERRCGRSPRAMKGPTISPSSLQPKGKVLVTFTPLR
jgi:hypothetical protein